MFENKSKIYVYVFILAFSLNWLWENWHSQFYLNYQSGAITQWILARAALADALIILVIYLLALYLFQSKTYQAVFIIIIGIGLAIVIEKVALSINWWTYAESMLVIPWLETGLTPTIQLGVLGWLSFLIGSLKKVKL